MEVHSSRSFGSAIEGSGVRAVYPFDWSHFQAGCCHNMCTAGSACLFPRWTGQVASSLSSALGAHVAHLICVLIISILIKFTKKL